jgi:hypothetical protein
MTPIYTDWKPESRKGAKAERKESDKNILALVAQCGAGRRNLLVPDLLVRFSAPWLLCVS